MLGFTVNIFNTLAHSDWPVFYVPYDLHVMIVELEIRIQCLALIIISSRISFYTGRICKNYFECCLNIITCQYFYIFSFEVR